MWKKRTENRYRFRKFYYAHTYFFLHISLSTQHYLPRSPLVALLPDRLGHLGRLAYISLAYASSEQMPPSSFHRSESSAVAPSLYFGHRIPLWWISMLVAVLGHICFRRIFSQVHSGFQSTPCATSSFLSEVRNRMPFSLLWTTQPAGGLEVIHPLGPASICDILPHSKPLQVGVICNQFSATALGFGERDPTHTSTQSSICDIKP